MGKKRAPERKAELVASKNEAQEKKARKKILKLYKEDNINLALKNFRAEIEQKSKTTEHGKWIPFEGIKPTPRAHSSFTILPNGTSIMFGGEFYNGVEVTLYNDTFMYNANKNEWFILHTPVKPIPRCSHQAVYFNNRLYIFGGEYNTLNQFHHFNDMYCLCLKTMRWSQVPVTGDIPSARSGHRMVLWNEYWVLFGGFHDNSKEVAYFNDLYAFNFKEYKWISISQKRFADSLPQPRASSLLAPQSNGTHILMFGGFSKAKDNNRNVSGNYHNDSWLINIEAGISGNDSVLIWERANTTFKPPFSTGFGHGIYRNFCIVFGGVSDVDDGGLSLKSTFYNQCYLLNVDQRRWYPLTNNNDSKMKDDEDPLSEDLNKISLVPDTPRPRMNPHVAVHSNTLLIYGGVVEHKNVEITLSDMWSFDLNKRDAWKCIDQGYIPEEFWEGNDIESGSDSEDVEMTSCDDYSQDSNEEYDSEMKSSSDKDTVPQDPRPGEKLSEYYIRTKDFWAEQCIMDENLEMSVVEVQNDKGLKAEIFSMCKDYYNKCSDN
ncbi:kelch domain-containing protein [Theileria equi strain WA]|uniref:Kelch domain-containing protein n=1 Tax=Theileria equi strain WA TaxID=1537102 RepID=L0B0F8_THEEQ|nr:kelch domain-containing protein [Theileria equi strain WA]AFZ81300.1 kelch domain-containing protein [Theileria equi strain WA]|eukprot:XP_004830966.1 kelch domain-containing protein [Theileria equi strain WA]